jgi:hypothetical protein
MKIRALLFRLVLLVFFLGCDGEGTGPVKNQVASVTVSPSSSTLGIGATTQLSAQVKNEAGALLTTSVTWSTSDASLAACSGSGMVTGVSEGVVTIMATAGGVSGAASISVVDLSVPDPPSDLIATPLSNTEIQVSWTDNSDNEDEFKVDREQIAEGMAGTSGGSARVLAEAGTVGPNVTTFSDTGLESGTSYRYRLLACNQNGCSDPSANQTEVSTFAELVIETTGLSSQPVGAEVEQTLRASGGDGTYTWLIASGSLPDGLDLAAESGTISGTPEAIGISDFSVQVQKFENSQFSNRENPEISPGSVSL